MAIPSLSLRASVRLPYHVSSPALRTGRAVFPHLGSPVGSCVSHTGPRSHPWTTPMGLAPVPYSIHVRSRSAARPVDALTTPSSSDDPFTFACDASGVSGPFTGVSGFRHSRDPSPFGHRSSPEAPSPPPALPGFSSTTSLSATLPAQPPPHGVPVRCVPHHPTGLPMLPPSSPSMRASATTPAGPRDARVARFPSVFGLPHFSGGSAPALPVSRPARRSLAFRPHVR